VCDFRERERERREGPAEVFPVCPFLSPKNSPTHFHLSPFLFFISGFLFCVPKCVVCTMCHALSATDEPRKLIAPSLESALCHAQTTDFTRACLHDNQLQPLFFQLHLDPLSAFCGYQTIFSCADTEGMSVYTYRPSPINVLCMCTSSVFFFHNKFECCVLYVRNGW